MSTPEELRDRSKRFAVRVVRLYEALPRSPQSQTMGKQLLRSGTSVAANYRAVCRARSKAEFIAKIGVVLEEADETVFWLEMLRDTGIVKPALLEPLLIEATELVCIFSASRQTAMGRR